jgi:hypothetical protein
VETVFGLKGNPHFNVLHWAMLLIAGGLVLAAACYQRRRPATGLVARMRHPQYVGFILIMFGFLLQWPTLLTLAMFPVLVFMYVRLSLSEERQAEADFGQAWRDYAGHTPRFWPRMGELAVGDAAVGEPTDQPHRGGYHTSKPRSIDGEGRRPQAGVDAHVVLYARTGLIR